MLALFLFLAFGILFGYFATLNTSVASVSFGSFAVEQVPIYLIVVISFTLGVIISSLFYTVRGFSTGLLLRKKDKELTDKEKDITEHMKTIHQLELENTKLKTKSGEEQDDEDSL